jgi:uncharacterized protein YbbK (DUF523 family)
MQKVAISACLLGNACRYDGTDNRNEVLIGLLEGATLVPFCPEHHAFGTPRPTMDLVLEKDGHVRARSNADGSDLSDPVIAYADAFFEAHPDIDLFIGKDRSPSCGVCSAKCYNGQRVLLNDKAAGLMAQEALRRGVESVDAETFLKEHR